MSRFVSSGTQQAPSDADDAWVKAQQQIDEVSQRRKLEGSGQQEGGKTLYDVLQANKAAKQEAFEESIRLKNQFRALDEDEIDFLDSVLESTRAKDAAIQKETTEQLDSFRKQQEDAEKAARAEQNDGESVEQEDSGTWQVLSRKRRKGRENANVSKGAKLRKLSSSETAAAGVQDRPPLLSPHQGLSARSGPPKASKAEKAAATAMKEHDTTTSPEKRENRPSEMVDTKSPSGVLSLGLVSYSSDEDD